MKKFLMILFLLFSFTTQASERDKYKFNDAFVRATPMKMSAGYVIIGNPTDKADTLLGAKAEWAGRIELHEIVEENSVVKMQQVKRMKLPAKGTLALRPNGLHLMLYQLKAPLKQGDKVTLTLQFAKAGNVNVAFRVMPVSYKGK